MGDFGIKISKTGYDIKNASSQNLSSSSAFNVFKVFKKGHFSLTTDGSGNAGPSTVSHGLGYTPGFYVFRKGTVAQGISMPIVYPGQSSDDCDVDAGSIYLTGAFIQFASDHDMGIRFASLNIPQGATILSAYIKFQAAVTEAGTISVNIYGEKSANPGTFTTRANFYSKTLTTASVPWTAPNETSGSYYNTPDISAIVQEIVNLADWGTYGSQSMLFELKRSGGTDFRRYVSWDGADYFTNFPPQLIVTYTTSPVYNNVYIPNPNNIVVDVDSMFDSIVYSDTVNLNFRMYQAKVSTTYNFVHYIFADTGYTDPSGSAPKGTGDYGIKVSLPSNDVKTAELYKLSLTSRLQQLKYNNTLSSQGTLSLPSLSSGGAADWRNFDITHNLGYSPCFMGFFKSSLNNPTWELEVPQYYQIGGVPSTNWNIYGYSDTSKVRFTVYRNPALTAHSAETIYLKYFIFNENLDLL